MRRLYDFGYRHFRMPWEVGPRRELVELVERGRIAPGRAIDLGCGTGANAIFLARHGFDVTGIDFAAAAIEKAMARAAQDGVNARFLVDDLTGLRGVKGRFDVLVDYGTFDDLTVKQRAAYLENVVPLSAPGSLFLLWCFEWPLRWWERVIARVIGIPPALEPGEVEQLFSRWFEIEKVAGSVDFTAGYPPGYAAYLMTRAPLLTNATVAPIDTVSAAGA